MRFSGAGRFLANNSPELCCTYIPTKDPPHYSAPNYATIILSSAGSTSIQMFSHAPKCIDSTAAKWELESGESTIIDCLLQSIKFQTLISTLWCQIELRRRVELSLEISILMRFIELVSMLFNETLIYQLC